MATMAVYTALSLLNLVGFAVGVSFLPAEVPIHFDASMTADALGSPWVYLALPGAAALVSIGMWATLGQKKNRKITLGILSAVGGIFATLGWAFFALAASGANVGEKTGFPLMLVIVLPLSLLFVWLGHYMPHIEPNRVLGIRTASTRKSEEVWRKTHRLGGVLFFAAGIVSALGAVVFGCVPALAPVQYLAFAVFAVSAAVAAVASCVYAKAIAGRIPEEPQKETEE